MFRLYPDRAVVVAGGVARGGVYPWTARGTFGGVQLTVDLVSAPEMPDVTVVALTGEIDLATAPQLREGLQRAESSARRGLLVDLRGVSFIDSTGIGELVGCHRRCRDDGRQVVFLVPDGTTRKILTVTGMDGVFDIHRDEDSAVLALGGSRGSAPASGTDD
jgi:anti-sigma B factor antagonist